MATLMWDITKMGHFKASCEAFANTSSEKQAPPSLLHLHEAWDETETESDWNSAEKVIRDTEERNREP